MPLHTILMHHNYLLRLRKDRMDVGMVSTSAAYYDQQERA